MKRKATVRILASLTALALMVPLGAEAYEDFSETSSAFDNMPAVFEMPGVVELPAVAPVPGSCEKNLIGQVEDLNDKIKPIKEWIGYVRSPQGLAIKLVNDHVVKIPPWVGFAMDPVGTIKHRAIDEVRARAKEAMGYKKGGGCAATDAPENTDSLESTWEV